jgi:hypothetical protein
MLYLDGVYVERPDDSLGWWQVRAEALIAAGSINIHRRA